MIAVTLSRFMLFMRSDSLYCRPVVKDSETSAGTGSDFDAVIVGAGFAGLYMLHRLRAAGFRVRVYESGDGVGGTWFWNRYPGARCDVESLEYSYSFSDDLQQEWQWTERFPTQPEILRYLNHVADRFELRPDIALNTMVSAANYDEPTATWKVTLEDGTDVTARYVVMAVGCLSTARIPAFPGLDSYLGRTLHTGDWPTEGVDLAGLRVGVIGTGSSGVQVIPMVADDAAELYVFQRTANFTMPARNAPLAPQVIADMKARYPQLREQARTSRNGTLRASHDESAVAAPPELRRERFDYGWQRGGNDIVGSFNDFMVDQAANDLLAEFLRGQVRSIVTDPEAAASLTSQTYPVGAKRMCLGTDYYETFNRDNVTLVDLRKHPIESITPHGIRTDEREYELDAIVFATGYDAMTGSILRVDIHGRDGRSLRDDWAAGPHTYLGLASAGYPNLFFITGPGSPSVLSNVVVSIEQHVEWIGDFLEYLRTNHLTSSEADFDSQEAWVAHVNEVANGTLMPKAASWYMGANVPGKPQVFMPYVGGVGRYREICDEVAADKYRGFTTT
jgi:cyclohexanone monooxygenase